MRPTAPQPLPRGSASALVKAALPADKWVQGLQGGGPRTRLCRGRPGSRVHLAPGTQAVPLSFALPTPTSYSHELVCLEGMGFTGGWAPSPKLRINIYAHIGLFLKKKKFVFYFFSNFSPCPEFRGWWHISACLTWT